MTVIDWIETDDGCVETNVRFGEVISDEEVFFVLSFLITVSVY